MNESQSAGNVDNRAGAEDANAVFVQTLTVEPHPWPGYVFINGHARAIGEPIDPPGQARGPSEAPEYKSMFEAAVVALAQIDELLGVEPDGCNDPETTVSALKDYISGAQGLIAAHVSASNSRASHPGHAQPEQASEPTWPDAETGKLVLHLGLEPNTALLVTRFANALAAKLFSAQEKYGYDDGWMRSDWLDECRDHLREHLDKGDPRDVAAYCAFLWHHGATTAAQVQPGAEALDAARYRWLIETCGGNLHGKPSIESAFDDDIDDWRSATFFGLRSKESFDAAIDAAIHAEALAPTTKAAP